MGGPEPTVWAGVAVGVRAWIQAAGNRPNEQLPVDGEQAAPLHICLAKHGACPPGTCRLPVPPGRRGSAAGRQLLARTAQGGIAAIRSRASWRLQQQDVGQGVDIR
jgi:hypothetical protein